LKAGLVEVFADCLASLGSLNYKITQLPNLQILFAGHSSLGLNSSDQSNDPNTANLLQ
jgi:hypothetical protein